MRKSINGRDAKYYINEAMCGRAYNIERRYTVQSGITYLSISDDRYCLAMDEEADNLYNEYINMM